jgi:amino acid transporter
MLHVNVADILSVLVCSAYPTSGGLYYWSAAISKPKYKPVLSFFTGWFNLIGQLAGTAAVAFGLALVIVATISIGTDGTWVPTPGATVGVYIAILVLVGLLNTYATRSLGMMNVVSSK